MCRKQISQSCAPSESHLTFIASKVGIDDSLRAADDLDVIQISSCIAIDMLNVLWSEMVAHLIRHLHRLFPQPDKQVFGFEDEEGLLVQPVPVVFLHHGHFKVPHHLGENDTGLGEEDSVQIVVSATKTP